METIELNPLDDDPDWRSGPLWAGLAVPFFN